MGSVWVAACRVGYYFIKERVLRIKPKTTTLDKYFIYIVVENKTDVVAAFWKKEDAGTFIKGIDNYKVISCILS